MSSPSPSSLDNTFTWEIPAFSTYESGRAFSSASFTYEGKTLRLILLPNGYNVEGAYAGTTQVFIYLDLVSEHSNLKLTYEISLLKADESKWNPQSTWLLVAKLGTLMSLSPDFQRVKCTSSTQWTSSTTGSTQSHVHTFSILPMSLSSTIWLPLIAKFSLHYLSPGSKPSEASGLGQGEVRPVEDESSESGE